MHFIQTLINLIAAAAASLILFISSFSIVPAPHAVITPSVPDSAPIVVTPHNFPSAPATTTPKKISTKPKTTTSATPTTPLTQVVTQPTNLTPIKSQEQINTETRAALVNILCTTKYGGYLAPISASGVIIDSRGVILTNAHVGQFLLLRDYYTPGNVQCVVRMGSPAEPYYNAELLYLPPAWVAENASQITSGQAIGTGQNDYAFLRITGPVGTRTMPTSFPAVVLASSGPSLGEAMLLAAYPAGYLGGESIVKNLYQTSAVTYVSQLLNFVDGNPTELFSVGGTVVSQSGSSGGAVVSLYNGALKGIIAVETIAASTGNRDLRALTLAHINNSLIAAGKGGIVGLLQGDLATKAATFNHDVAPGETKLLEDALGKGN